MADYVFSSLPSVNIPRTKFARTFSHNLTFNLGEICILGIDECIPGSTHKLEFGSLIHMSTPIAPIMDDIQYDVFPFFVPLRLTWENWKRFMGENTTGAGAINKVNSDKVIPSVYIAGSLENSIADDLGIFAKKTSYTGTPISVLPFRAVKLILNRWFRNQNVESPLTVNLGDTPNLYDVSGTGLSYWLGTPSGTATDDVYTRPLAYKLPDYFTSALPYAQKGDPVSIPGLDNVLPVVTGSTQIDVTNLPSMKFRNRSTNTTFSNDLTVSGGVLKATSSAGSASTVEPVPSNLIVDPNALHGTINDLRFAFQLQKFLEKDALYGSRYWEILHAHYAVTAPDASLQDPQLLGRFKFDINISQVTQTSGFTSPSSTNLGTPGANSKTAARGHLCTFNAIEHGYLIIMGVARQKNHTYSNGINRMWFRTARTDFYFPVFANLGAQKVLYKELYVGGGVDEATFGYQEAWAEYRYIPSYNSGKLNPNRTGSLDYWTLADLYSGVPTLTSSFLKEDRTALTRCLVTGSTGPDFVGSWYFRDTCVNPMPLYSIPGLVDHH